MIQQNEINTLLNQPESQTLLAQSTSVGSWEVLSYETPVVAIHAALLRTGKVIFIAGSGLNPNEMDCADCSAVWDVNNGTFSRPVTPVDDSDLRIDLFCVGHSFRADGRLIVSGGTLAYNPYLGSTAALLFDPSTEQWTKVTSMNGGRWYPALVTLGNGRILAVSGLDENGNLNTQPEIYSSSFGWTAFSQPTTRYPLYAHLFLLSSGKLFYSGAYFEYNQGVTPRILTLPSQFTQAITEQEVTGLVAADQGGEAASVLLPPAQDQKVMIMGGYSTAAVTTDRVNIVDLKASTPTYTPAAPLNQPRAHHNAILLPDRTVFVCNGSRNYEDSGSSKLPAEIYNPATNTWRQVDPQTVTRIYHSTALLLSDGRVATAGSGPTATFRELKLEIYSPAYMSQPRPVIQSAPQTVLYGKSLTIQTPQAANIKWVSLIKPMATTHGLDTEQRLVDVPINSRTSSSLNVTVTNNRNLAPPGYYMLFITDNNDVPSVAHWIRLN